MKSVSISMTTPNRNAPAPQQQKPKGPAAQKFHVLPLSPCEDLQVLIETRAYELYGARGCRGGSALSDWLDAERESLSQIPYV
ncbi:MAG: DUF2934 domain-containing protein [Nitrospiraceae bacterium]|nr:DUF2934 domain-containing protein [Nitrospiraceae bacterium]